MHWSVVPGAVDMAPYAQFYKDTITSVLKDKVGDKIVVEIGVRFGCSARIIYEAIMYDEKCKLVLIDTVKHSEVAEVEEKPGVSFYIGKGEDFAYLFNEHTIDVLHLDVDPHEYEQTKTFFEIYKKSIKIGGVIIFHDCTPSFGVSRFVTKELEKMPGWIVRYAVQRPEAPVSTPAVAIKQM